MTLSSLINKICVVISAACLALSYILAGYWYILPVLLTMTLFWLLLHKRAASWLTSTLLFVYVFLAALGIAIHLSIQLLAVGCTGALVCWDLTDFSQSRSSHQPVGTWRSLEKYHLQSLAIAASAGLLLALTSSFLNFRLPFVMTVFLVLVAVGGIIYGLRSLGNH